MKKKLLCMVFSFVFLGLTAFAASDEKPLALIINNKTDQNVTLRVEKKGNGVLEQKIAVEPGANSVALYMVGFEKLGDNDYFIVQGANLSTVKKFIKGRSLTNQLPSFKANEIQTKQFVVEKCLTDGSCEVTVSDRS